MTKDVSLSAFPALYFMCNLLIHRNLAVSVINFYYVLSVSYHSFNFPFKLWQYLLSCSFSTYNIDCSTVLKNCPTCQCPPPRGTHSLQETITLPSINVPSWITSVSVHLIFSNSLNLEVEYTVTKDRIRIQGYTSFYEKKFIRN